MGGDLWCSGVLEVACSVWWSVVGGVFLRCRLLWVLCCGVVERWGWCQVV